MHVTTHVVTQTGLTRNKLMIEENALQVTYIRLLEGGGAEVKIFTFDSLSELVNFIIQTGLHYTKQGVILAIEQ